jgi:hypothetical protein
MLYGNTIIEAHPEQEEGVNYQGTEVDREEGVDTHRQKTRRKEKKADNVAIEGQGWRLTSIACS